MRSFLTGSITFLGMHLICCGTLLVFLISSGLLLSFSRESQSRVFLLPALALAGVVFWAYRHHGNCCRERGLRTTQDRIVSWSIYLLLSVTVGIIFMIYIFIPWWIPNYKGGPLLP